MAGRDDSPRVLYGILAFIVLLFVVAIKYAPPDQPTVPYEAEDDQSQRICIEKGGVPTVGYSAFTRWHGCVFPSAK